jgi:hypothetical protein
MLEADYYYAGQPGTFTQDHRVFGPTNGNYEFDDEYPVVTWAPCHFNATVNIDTSLQVFQGADPSFFNEMTMDSTDVGIATIFHLSFKHC